MTSYGLIGGSTSRSLSPAIHEAAYAALSMSGNYLTIDVDLEGLTLALDGARTLGFRGLNVTAPLKEAVLPLLDEVSPEAARIGAVNTLTFDPDGRVVGDNTDARGLVASIRENDVPLADASVVVVGSGGAARAAVFGLLDADVGELRLLSRRIEPAETIRAHCADSRVHVIGLDCEASVRRALIGATLLIHATPATREMSERLPVSELAPQAAVLDMVYRPLMTPLLARAGQLSRKQIDGLGMLVHQAALSFEIWTHQPAPIEAMRAAAYAHADDGGRTNL